MGARFPWAELAVLPAGRPPSVTWAGRGATGAQALPRRAFSPPLELHLRSERVIMPLKAIMTLL